MKAFESEEYTIRREETGRNFQEQEQELFAGTKGPGKNSSSSNAPLWRWSLTVPMVNGKPMTDQDFFALTEEQRADIIKRQESFREELKAIARKARDLEKEFNKSIFELEQKVALFNIENLLEDLLDNYRGQQGVVGFLQDIKDNILDNLQEFIQAGNPVKGKDQEHDGFRKQYEVNVIVDNSNTEGAPIILELNPTYNNLFGKVEKESQMGAGHRFHAHPRRIAARGQWRIYCHSGRLPAPQSLFLESLKRALRNREIVPEDAIERLGYLTTKSLKPEAIPLNVQVILIGKTEYYYLLYELDDEFNELFKVKADFMAFMPDTEENIRDFCGFVNNLCKEDTLPLDAKGMATLLEHAHRLADHQQKLSTQFGRIADVIIEAHHYAKKEAAKAISSPHLQQAIRERFLRSNGMQERIHEFLKEGVYLLDVDGEKVGQVNGLAVLEMGDISFGRPWQPHHRQHLRGQRRHPRYRARSQARRTDPHQGRADPVGISGRNLRSDKPISLQARLGSSKATAVSKATALRAPSSTRCSRRFPASPSARASP